MSLSHGANPTPGAAAPTIADRLAPTRRPAGPPIGYQDWRRLLFLHWTVPEDKLRPLVPARLSLDLHAGMAYVGLVPFIVRDARPIGVPAALGLSFLETNVRTYVHLDGRDPGVYFFSLDAASLAAVLGARLTFGLPYFYAHMRRQHDAEGGAYATRRRSGSRPGSRVRYALGEPLGASQPGTLEHFLIERYLLHVERGPTLWTVQVHHAPYPVQRGRVLDLEDELLGAAGIDEPTAPPLVHYAAGVNVELFAPRISLASALGERDLGPSIGGCQADGDVYNDPSVRRSAEMNDVG